MQGGGAGGRYEGDGDDVDRSYEELCRAHMESIMAAAAAAEVQTELTTRVAGYVVARRRRRVCVCVCWGRVTRLLMFWIFCQQPHEQLFMMSTPQSHGGTGMACRLHSHHTMLLYAQLPALQVASAH